MIETVTSTNPCPLCGTYDYWLRRTFLDPNFEAGQMPKRVFYVTYCGNCKHKFVTPYNLIALTVKRTLRKLQYDDTRFKIAETRTLLSEIERANIKAEKNNP